MLYTMLINYKLHSQRNTNNSNTIIKFNWKTLILSSIIILLIRAIKLAHLCTINPNIRVLTCKACILCSALLAMIHTFSTRLNKKLKFFNNNKKRIKRY